jgi:hypothetical protein
MRRSSRGASKAAAKKLKEDAQADKGASDCGYGGSGDDDDDGGGSGDDDDDDDFEDEDDKSSSRRRSRSARRFSGSFGNISNLKLKPKQVRCFRRIQAAETGCKLSVHVESLGTGSFWTFVTVRLSLICPVRVISCHAFDPSEHEQNRDSGLCSGTAGDGDAVGREVVDPQADAPAHEQAGELLISDLHFKAGLRWERPWGLA